MESTVVSVAAQGLEVALLCREGLAEPGVGSQYLSITETGGGVVIVKPPAHPAAVHSPSPKSFRKSKFEDGAARLVAVL